MRKFFLISIAFLTVAALLPRQLALWIGERQAAAIVVNARDDESRIIAVARWVAEQYPNDRLEPAWLAIARLAESKHLPMWLRVPSGTAEFATRSGLCDSAVRTLQFLLTRLGFQSEQLNMITLRSGHTALAVTLNGRATFIDPFYGIAAFNNGRLQNLDFLVSAMRRDRPIDEAMLALREEPTTDYYEEMKNTRLFRASQGRDAKIKVAIPKLKSRLMIGSVDGATADMIPELVKHKLTPYFTYIGSLYDAAWTRTLVARQDLQIRFILIENADSDIIQSAPPPTIEGKVVSWSLKAGESLVLYDKRASLRLFEEDVQMLDALEIVPQQTASR